MLRFRERENCEIKERKRGTLDCSFVSDIQNKPTRGGEEVVFLSTPEGKRWIYSFGFVDVYWLFSCLQQSEQRKEVSLTLLLPAQITLSQVGAKWKLNRFFFFFFK